MANRTPLEQKSEEPREGQFREAERGLSGVAFRGEAVAYPASGHYIHPGDEVYRGAAMEEPLGAMPPGLAPLDMSAGKMGHDFSKMSFDHQPAAMMMKEAPSGSLSGDMVVEPLPHFLEMTAVKSPVSSASKIVERLRAVIDKMPSADCQNGRDKQAKLKVILWRMVYVAKIVITIFRDPKDGQLVVEFQRRRGDRYVFHQFFREVVQKATDVFGAQAHIPRAAPMFGPMDLPFEDESIGEEGFRPLVEMIFSPYNDVSVDGARALVAATQNPKSLQFIACHEEIAAVVDHLLSSNDSERACCGTHLLADITNQQCITKFAELVTNAFRFFDETGIEWHETHRQLARATANFKNASHLIRDCCKSESSRYSLRSGSLLTHFRGQQRSELSSMYHFVSGTK